ncbi:ROK family protein [Octadecabacter sp. 1_MG-2023]|uniref:ROK family protein n=1 Tax=unclassified Octadecabacter TaxID=196158 RepID=UPI001C09B1AB|nr:MULTISPECIES: ROK family protein [unclassified Octadecabacter]MBU2994635.1 ROK family protein [Octadecabacter sp. B2R22]MDO6734072.1 ROK family protein [Octadecabacter sp. 1_MG-2023]
MTAIGLDLGGTKIEAQIFDADWQVEAKRRVETPKDYAPLLTSITDLVAWADDTAGTKRPIGIGAAGLINPHTGKALTANICANGQTIHTDIARALGRDVTYINDSRALTLSEAVFGAGKAHATVMAVILGTGIGGGIAVDGKLRSGATHTGGEFGHTSLPADLVAQHGLPLVPCGCGAVGCVETYVSGPGMERLALALTGTTMTTHEIAAKGTPDAVRVWLVWLTLAADLLRNLILTTDPDVIVLAGGLSNIASITDDLARTTRDAQIGDFAIPPIVLAQGGDASGARGAAYAAWQNAND